MSLHRVCPTCSKDRPPTSFRDGSDDCFRCRALSISVSPSSMPTRAGAGLWQAKREEQHLSVDGEAYKRLRRDGFQPKSINGSANLEANATTRFEIESGRVYEPGAVKAALGQFEDVMGHAATTPITKPIDSGDAA